MRNKLPARLGLMCLLVLQAAGCAAGPGSSRSAAAHPHDPPVLAAFRKRLALAHRELPLIEQAASAAADRVAVNPKALIQVPYGRQQSFAEEILNRAGGLANALPPEERPTAITPQDVLLISARAWDLDAPKVRASLEEANRHGWLVVLFASAAGTPADIHVDYLIDNGAAGPGRDEAPMNAIANALNSWLWTCEYVAAMSRHAKYPAVLVSILAPGSAELDAKLQANKPYPDGRYTTYDAATPIAAGQLSARYFRRVDQLLETVASPEIQGPLNHAADLIADELHRGGHVIVSSCTHILMSEVMTQEGETPRTPMTGIQCVWHAKDAFKKAVQPGDMVVWFGYVGISTPYEDYFGAIRATGAPIISCCVTDKDNPANNAANAIEHIEQSWQPPDAEVPIPFAPGAMAPVSGVDQGLLWRMLEDAVATRLAQAAPPAAK